MTHDTEQHDSSLTWAIPLLAFWACVVLALLRWL
jgi:hypothetical protein